MEIPNGISMADYTVSGPAVVLSDGSEEWWINGNEFTKKEFNQFLEKKALNERLQELPQKHTVKRSKI
jgi:ribosomal protein L20A (L18A)